MFLQNSYICTRNFTKLDVIGNRNGDNNSHDSKFTQLPRPNR